MSELKPDSEKKEERLSDKEKVNTEKTNAVLSYYSANSLRHQWR